MNKLMIVFLALILFPLATLAHADPQALTAGETQLAQLLQGKVLYCVDLGNKDGQKDEVTSFEIEYRNGAILSLANGQSTQYGGNGVVLYDGTYISKAMLVVAFEDNSLPPEPEHNLIISQNELAELLDGRVPEISAVLQYHDTGLNGYGYAYYSVACRIR